MKGIERREKCRVAVVARYDQQGTPWPLWVEWEDGRHFLVDKVIERRRAASMKTGGHGWRYTCRMGGHTKYLWKDDQGWYVERIVNEGESSLGGRTVIRPREM